MTTSFYTIDILLDKFVADEPMTDAEAILFGEWRSRSDEHRVLPEKFRDEQWVGQGLRELPALAMKQTLAYILATVSAFPARRIWRWQAVAAAVLLCILFSLVASIRYTSPDNDTILAASIMTFTNGVKMKLDGQPNGVITGDPGFRTITKNSDTLVYTWRKNIRRPRLMNDVSTDSGKELALLLPDGSKVGLKGASRIGALASLDDGTRVLSLDGEADFDVAPHGGQPFVVFAGGMRISVLGTAFNIKAYPGAKTHSVTVTRGRVQVDSGAHSVLLDTVKNNVAEFTGVDMHVRLEPIAGSLPGAPVKRLPLRIKNDELETVVRKVAGFYGMKVDNPQHIDDVKVHGTFYPDKDVRYNTDILQNIVGGRALVKVEGDTIRILPAKP